MAPSRRASSAVCAGADGILAFAALPVLSRSLALTMYGWGPPADSRSNKPCLSWAPMAVPMTRFTVSMTDFEPECGSVVEL
uniref:Putative secreted peptide n=1 Tax=Anopheles braziliensis TaxID=58242 RepID=A0A2M3ZR54_9DIPT